MITWTGRAQESGLNVYIINADGTGFRSPSARFTVGHERELAARGPIWSPDGKSLLFTLYERTNPSKSSIYLTEVEPDQVRLVGSDTESAYVKDWLADGRIVYFSRTTSLEVCLMAADGTQRQSLARYGEYIELVVSPTGQKIALLQRDDFSVLIRDLQSGEQHVIAQKTKGKRANLHWSPDGSQIAFMEARSRYAAPLRMPIFVVNLEDARLLELGRVDSESDFAWSPTGTMLAGINCRRTGKYTLDLIELASARQTAVVDLRNNPELGVTVPPTPAWSPDGTHLVYGTYRDQYANLNLFELDKKIVKTMIGDENKLEIITDISWGR